MDERAEERRPLSRRRQVAGRISFAVEGEYLEVDPPRKVVFTWEPDWDAGERSTVTYRLAAVSGGTRVTIRHDGFQGRPESCENHSVGWQSILGWLSRFVTPSEAKVSYHMCQLIAPRPTFPFDATPAEQEFMQGHFGYWQGLVSSGVAVLVGAVMDPNGAWGAAVVGVRDPAELPAIEQGDPIIRANVGFRYRIMPMPNVLLPR